MTFMKSFLSFSFLLALAFTCTNAARFDVTNKCPHTLWAAAVPAGGGKQLNSGETWSFDVPAGTNDGRIWARTNCTFDGSGRGHCETGDCGGLLQCQVHGTPPNTLAEFSLNFRNIDFFDISLMEGFNVPMEFSPTSNGCTEGIKCSADIIGECPSQLKTQGGCNGPCTVFKNDRSCCNSDICEPSNYSKFFKNRCPNAFTYLKDAPTSLFLCPSGKDYRVVFCP